MVRLDSHSPPLGPDHMDATPTVRLSEAIFYLEACRRVIADGQTLNAAHLDKAIQAFVEVRELLTADPRDE